ncbi:MAG: DUF4199 domain-containing protein [Ignavibacteria bacterium]|nr:DUF4199 domain-containing protein [Ignavibacteria bacterium]
MTEIKYGIFSSFLLFIWMVIEYTLLVPNFHEIGVYIGIVPVIIPVIGIYLGIKERREKINFGYITFKDAFRTGLVITFIVAIMIVLFIYVYYEFMNPNYVNFLAAETEKTLIKQNAGREEINAAVTIIKYQFSFNVQIIQQLLFILTGGTAITFILSMIMKREKRSKS